MHVWACNAGGLQVACMPDADGFEGIVQALHHAALLVSEGRVGQAGGDISLVGVQALADDLIQL